MISKLVYCDNVWVSETASMWTPIGTVYICGPLYVLYVYVDPCTYCDHAEICDGALLVTLPSGAIRRIHLKTHVRRAARWKQSLLLLHSCYVDQ
jgi:hypothetical protein